MKIYASNLITEEETVQSLTYDSVSTSSSSVCSSDLAWVLNMTERNKSMRNTTSKRQNGGSSGTKPKMFKDVASSQELKKLDSIGRGSSDALPTSLGQSSSIPAHLKALSSNSKTSLKKEPANICSPRILPNLLKPDAIPFNFQDQPASHATSYSSNHPPFTSVTNINHQMVPMRMVHCGYVLLAANFNPLPHFVSTDFEYKSETNLHTYQLLAYYAEKNDIESLRKQIDEAMKKNLNLEHFIDHFCQQSIIDGNIIMMIFFLILADHCKVRKELIFRNAIICAIRSRRLEMCTNLVMQYNTSPTNDLAFIFANEANSFATSGDCAYAQHLIEFSLQVNINLSEYSHLLFSFYPQYPYDKFISSHEKSTPAPDDSKHTSSSCSTDDNRFGKTRRQNSANNLEEKIISSRPDSLDMPLDLGNTKESGSKKRRRRARRALHVKESRLVKLKSCIDEQFKLIGLKATQFKSLLYDRPLRQLSTREAGTLGEALIKGEWENVRATLNRIELIPEESLKILQKILANIIFEGSGQKFVMNKVLWAISSKSSIDLQKLVLEMIPEAEERGCKNFVDAVIKFSANWINNVHKTMKKLIVQCMCDSKIDILRILLATIENFKINTKEIIKRGMDKVSEVNKKSEIHGTILEYDLVNQGNLHQEYKKLINFYELQGNLIEANRLSVIWLRHVENKKIYNTILSSVTISVRVTFPITQLHKYWLHMKGLDMSIYDV